ncbi:MAG: hypothetical protein HQ567_04325, partial [Candidatus Nealsonbacteria bacterium]|nr:hypothetical protein [Candidatus Nealsonbacteria bacterium]
MNRSFFPWTLCVLLLYTLAPTPAPAFDPPTDTVGPLTVRIDGPEVVTETDKPLPVRVLIDNKSDRAVTGSVQLHLIDRWRAEPAGPVPFSVDAQGTASCQFKVVAGKGTYSAHYPIHAYARFESGGEKLTAHPILIVETKLPRAARAPIPMEWKPFSVQEGGELALWRLPVHRS